MKCVWVFGGQMLLGRADDIFLDKGHALHRRDLIRNTQQ